MQSFSNNIIWILILLKVTQFIRISAVIIGLWRLFVSCWALHASNPCSDERVRGYVLYNVRKLIPNIHKPVISRSFRWVYRKSY